MDMMPDDCVTGVRRTPVGNCDVSQDGLQEFPVSC